MRIGIIGLPASGKTTLFNALTGGAARTGGYGGAEAHVGVAKVDDPRVDALAEIFRPKKTIHATVEFADVPGLGESAEGRAGRDGEANIPPPLLMADALLLLLRAFEAPGIPHPRQSVDPARDLEDARLDLVLRDLAVAERRVERLKRLVALKKNPEEEAEFKLLKVVQGALEEGRPVRDLDLSPEENGRLRGFGFLSAKPLLVVVNAGEERIGEACTAFGLPPAESDTASVLCAKLEEEIAGLPEEDRADYLAGYGLERPAADRVAKASFALLDLRCFFTTGEDEVRAWPVRAGTAALKAAGTVHSDMERGFIRAEVISYEEFMAAGSMAEARKRGTLRLEGKSYEIQDGDIFRVRFNV